MVFKRSTHLCKSTQYHKSGKCKLKKKKRFTSCLKEWMAFLLTRSVAEDVDKKETLYLLDRMPLIAITENSIEVLQKLKLELYMI